jgi:flagellar basal-body rod modification protein FlgD
MISGTNNTSNAPDPTGAPIPASAKKDPLADKSVFLELLVAQIKNQDPTKPQDGMAFMSQLAQFSGVEQSLAMTKELTAIHDILAKQADPMATESESGQ